jgi:vacuolar-type H+-ATPase subunit I/STV1
MKQITVRLKEETIEELENEADEAGVSRSEHIRDVIASRGEHEAEVERMREEVDDFRREVDRLRNEKRALIDDREERAELVEYVEREKSLQEERLEASAVERAKWWLFGRDA